MYTIFAKEAIAVSTKTLTLVAVLTAVLCICGPLAVPIGPVPISLTSGVLMLIALLLGAGRSTLCCAVYLLLGLVGLPVFSSFRAGMSVLAGPTGGYLVGFLPMTALGGYFCARTDKRTLQAAALVAATALLYVLGTAWFVYQTGKTLPVALGACVLPFLPGDALKILLVVTAGNLLKDRLKKANLL